MRILHVTPFYEPAWAYGGMARGSSGLCRALVRRGHEVTVATSRLEPSQSADESLGGVRVRRFDGPAFLQRRLVPVARGLGEFVRTALPACDIVHIHGHRNGLAVTASRVLAAARRPWVLQTSGTFPYHGQHALLKALFDRAWGDLVVAGAAALVAVSEAEARDLPRAARVVPNGVLSAGTAARTRSGGRPRLLFVGSDRPQKRGHRLPSLLAAVPDAELHLVGPMGDRFRHLFDRFGDRVRAHGVLAGDALAAAYADADVVVFPAVGDAFGLVPFEAALAGTAAVVAGGHGCGEWFARAGGGVVPPDDDRALAEAVRVRLADPAQRRRESQAVALFVTRHLTWDEAAARTLSLYGDVLEGRA